MGYIRKKYLFNLPSSIFKSRKMQGFTLMELMVAISIVSVLTAIALPRLNQFVASMRVDNEISELQRLLLTARNMAINTGQNTTVCPLSGINCTTNWQNEISVFTNGAISANNNSFDVAADSTTDVLIKVKEGIKSGDSLQFAANSVVYSPTGQLLSAQNNFSYCPQDEDDESRGIFLSISGRSYISSDTDSDGKDEDRNGNEIACN